MKKDVVIMAVLCVVASLGIVFMWNEQDRVPPTITISDNPIEYVEDDIDSLLTGVTAHDDRDGDVSDSIYIKVSMSKELNKVYVTYYAKDSSNNVSKAMREVEVSNTVALPTLEPTPELTSELTAEPTAEPTLPPTQDAEVTSEPEVASTSPQITLTEEKILIAQGTSINRIHYVKDITDDKDARDILFNHIQIVGEVDTEIPGSYDLIYFVVDSDGNQSNEAKLTVIVE